MIPVQRGVHLDFNYWIRNNRLEVKGLHEVINSLVAGNKSACLGHVHPPKDNVVIVTLAEVNHEVLSCHLSACPFLSNCSSVPTLIVDRAGLPNITNQGQIINSASPSYDWYYSDVKDLNAQLLWPTIPRTLANERMQLKDLVDNNLMTFKCMDVDWIDHLTLLPSPQVHVQVTAIIDTLAQQVAVSQTVGGAEVDESQDGGQQEKPLSPAMRALLYEVGKVPDASDKTAGCRYGKVYRHRSAEGGLFVYFPPEDKLLVIWDRGEVSLLHSSSSSGSLTYVDYEQGLEMTQHSHIPLSSIHIPYALPTPIPSPAKPTVSLLEEVRVVFASLSPISLRNLVLGKEALAMCGYMLDRGGYVCLETHSPTWGSGKGASFTPQTPSPAVQMDLEEGEEVEGEVAENGAIEGLAGGGWAPAHSKLLAQAKVYVILPAPLDFVALDCEMCLTEAGLEVCRVSLLHPLRGVVLDALVKPDRPVRDYLTEFSGVTQELLEGITITLSDIQYVLPSFISARTVIIGHSLEGDLKCLHLVHRGVSGGGIIDVSALYPHPSSLPYRLPLKKLAKEVLGRDIQGGDVEGHDSVQDAAAALLLALYFAKEQETGRKDECCVVPGGGGGDRFFFQQPRYTLFEQIVCMSDTRNVQQWQVRVNERLALPHLKRWEADALGYKRDGSASYVAGKFQERVSSSSSLSLSFQSTTLSSDPLDNHDFTFPDHPNREQENSYPCLQYWQLSLSHYKERADVQSKYGNYCGQNECDPADGSTREEGDGNGHSGAGSYIEDLDKDLQVLYNSLPDNSVMLVLTQGSLVDLRKLIASKTRNKWQVQQAARGQKICLPIDPAYKGRRTGAEWQSEDEAILLEEAQKAAHGCMFI
eukprot:gene32456-39244_t